MKPIIEVQIRRRCGRRNSYRSWLILRHPVSQGVLARRMIGSTLTHAEVAERTRSFIEWGSEWFRITFCTPAPVIDRCDTVLL